MINVTGCLVGGLPTSKVMYISEDVQKRTAVIAPKAPGPSRSFVILIKLPVETEQLRAIRALRLQEQSRN